MTDFRIEARLGCISFACDPDAFPRQMALHQALARRAGWDGEAVVRQIEAEKHPGVTMAQARALEENRIRMARERDAAVARWTKALQGAKSWADVSRAAGVNRRACQRAVHKYGLKIPFGSRDNDTKRAVYQRAWRNAFAQAATVREAAALMRCKYETARLAGKRYGLTLGRATK